MSQTTITIPDALNERVEKLATLLDTTPDQLVERALTAFIRAQQTQSDDTQKAIHVNQGDIYWVEVDASKSPHPHVIVQADVLNHSRIDSVVACALTSNIQRVNIPGNILLDDGEANLTRQSVVEVGKVSAFAKSRLGEYIGTLTPQRVAQILDGMRFQQVSFFNR